MILKRLLLSLFIFLYMFYENWLPTPSCTLLPGQQIHHPNVGDDLKVMMVADLMLSGRDSGSRYWDLHFKDFYFSRFFKKSFDLLKPDMLIVLGDLSSQGSELSKRKWSYVVQEFHSLLGPFLDLPYHVVPGDRDIGECSRLNELSANKISRSFPGLDPSGCGAFDIGNVNFVSLNSVALLCGNNDLRFSVERALERERIELQTENEQVTDVMKESSGIKIPKYEFNWIENTMLSGSGPVLLLHFPLHQTTNDVQVEGYGSMQDRAELLKKRQPVGDGPYKLSQTLPLNATEYIFHALRPRMIFSAHTQTFSDRVHPDGTREIVVPAMSWDAGNNPAFVSVTFRHNGTTAIVSHCRLAGKLHVLLLYTSLFFVFILTVQTSLRS
ncbi:putative calcineurin-like phosphoesterase domain, ApaH type, metallo-dependent phosphatase [Helianthus annuus]|nr:putative calcineurin-like phosphoesterase domain, ApaH type, metallo-dependent phosphatase [Helianthus annuus]